MNGFIRVATITPKVSLANPDANAEAVLALVREVKAQGGVLAVAPELSLTGATCGDLFVTQALLQQTLAALGQLCASLPEDFILVCGAPILAEGQLLDCAVVVQRDRILGIVPRTTFAAADTLRRCFSVPNAPTIAPDLNDAPIDPNLLFDTGDFTFTVGFGLQPDTTTVAKGHLCLLLDAAAEGVGRAAMRRNAVQMRSLDLDGACLYAAAGEGESSTDGVYGGQRLMAWEGRVLAEAQWETGLSLMDFSPKWVTARRLRTARRGENRASARVVRCEVTATPCDARFAGLRANPFIPQEEAARAARCREVLSLQSEALKRRFTQIHAKRLVLGLSGGLDSTLALVVCARLCRTMNLPSETVLAVTMPGFGTTSRTYRNAVTLAKTLGAELREISIVPCVERHFEDIAHDVNVHDVTYENAQARARTYILMDLANQEGGLLVGTGDLSEIALGWSTYNGDHMSMYSVNCGVPKTLIAPCLAVAAEECAACDAKAGSVLREVLRDICDTPVSPELVPGAQHTEKIVGRYELHDCFLWYFLRYGCAREELAELGALLHGEINEDERERTLDIFCRRVISQQFKRSCSPDGAAIGGVGLSPRGGWMLPSDANLTL